MDDLIGVAIIAAQYSLAIFGAQRYLGMQLPRELLVGIFIAYAAVGIAVWHKKQEWRNAVPKWAKLTLGSVAVTIASVSMDSLLGYLEGAKPVFTGGGIFGFPVTVLLCPPLTMISVAGLVRALYSRSSSQKAIGRRTNAVDSSS